MKTSGSTTASFFGSNPETIKPGQIGKQPNVNISPPSEEDTITTLDISEDFYSVQCEGVTTGYPAYFIRLKACNLMCGGPDGSLMKEGKATWWCDSEYVWKKGLQKPFDYLVKRWSDQSILDWIIMGRVHLIWTGGEPTIPRHQSATSEFLKYFNTYVYEWKHVNASIYNEIETNGTVYIEDQLFTDMDQINCSVKLSNSGMTKARRIKPLALERIMRHKNYWSKFVISNESKMVQ
jgi:organic radical activating enzyme